MMQILFRCLQDSRYFRVHDNVWLSLIFLSNIGFAKVVYSQCKAVFLFWNVDIQLGW
uniref:Uncharacterized protein n=1 Tax=Rhizophora mucronata TaxID=61149 RepID=A0A2P2P1M8_RHIMU